MRRFMIIACFLTLAVMSFGQAHSFVYLGAGLSGTTTHLRGLNDVIDRYNETRQGQEGAASLTRELDHFSTQSGYEFSLGFVQDDAGWFADLHLSGLEAKTYAEGFNLDGTAARRDLELETISFSAGVGASIVQNNHMEIGLGGAINITRTWVVSSGTGLEKERIFEDPVPVYFAPFTQATLFLSRKIPLALFGRAFFEIPVLKSDYAELNEALNPYTYGNDEDLDFSSRNWRAGYTVGLAFIFHERDRSFHQ